MFTSVEWWSVSRDHWHQSLYVTGAIWWRDTVTSVSRSQVGDHRCRRHNAGVGTSASVCMTVSTLWISVPSDWVNTCVEWHCCHLCVGDVWVTPVSLTRLSEHTQEVKVHLKDMTWCYCVTSTCECTGYNVEGREKGLTPQADPRELVMWDTTCCRLDTAKKLAFASIPQLECCVDFQLMTTQRTLWFSLTQWHCHN